MALGPNALSRGDAANELVDIALGPSSHIQGDKAFSGCVRPGAAPALVQEYVRRAGITERTGTEVRTGP